MTQGQFKAPVFRSQLSISKSVYPIPVPKEHQENSLQSK